MHDYERSIIVELSWSCRRSVGGAQEHVSMAWKTVVGEWRAASLLWIKNDDTWDCRVRMQE